MKILTFFLFFQVIFASRIHDSLIGKSPFTRRTLDDFLRGMNELAKIERQINDIAEDENENYNFEEKAMEVYTGRPWQLPYLFEGDIILTPLQLQETINYAKRRLAEKNGEVVKERPERTLTSSTRLRWTTFPIPFSVNSGVNRSAILAGVQLWQDNTCLTFRENGAGSNRIQFFYGSGCYSSIGMVGGTQQISIGLGCDYPAIVAHEIGHSLGYYHEQARFDRDNWVQILTQNIQSGMESQFSKQSPSSMITYGVPYDYGSVMHYDPYGFTSNNQPTIQTLDVNFMDTIGQRSGLSFNDVKKMNFAYCNSTCPTKLSCRRGGYTDPKDCSRCRCPDGLGGTFCDQPLTTTSDCGTILLSATPNTQTLTKSGAANCNYLIQAPVGQHVVITVDNVRFNGYSPCETSYVEIKYGADITDTGARLCDGVRNNQVTSQSNEVLVIYKSNSRSSSFAITFGSDGPAVETTTTTTTTTTAATTTTSSTDTTTTTSGTTTESTTTTTDTPTTTTSTTTRRPWTTTTTTRRPWTTTTRRPMTTRPHRTTTPWEITTCPPVCIWGGDGGADGKGLPPICPEYCVPYDQNPTTAVGHGQKDDDSSDSSSAESQVLRSVPIGSPSRFAEFDKKLEEIKKEAIKMMISVVENYRKSFDVEVEKKKFDFESELSELKKFLADTKSEAVGSVSTSSKVPEMATEMIPGSEIVSETATLGTTEDSPMMEEIKLDGAEKSAETFSRVRRSSFAHDYLKSKLETVEDLEQLMGLIEKYQHFFNGKYDDAKQDY